MRFASSELLKIETALVRKPSASALCDALAFDFAALLRAPRYAGHPALRWAGSHCVARQREAVWR
jgi:hypothetical protein